MNSAMSDSTREGAKGFRAFPSVTVHLVFLLSGLSALFYQIAWQRALMLIYGSNTESVAIVVSAFLVGLGLGNLAGGELSGRLNINPILLFGIAEVVIGLYGVVSLPLFRWAGAFTLASGPIQTGLVVFALVLLPTLLMGATLPLLVSHQIPKSRQVGLTVSWLYCVNTLGAALGAFLSGFVLLGAVGLQNTVRTAAALNLLTGAIVMLIWIRAKGRR